MCPLKGQANLGLSGSLWGWPSEPVPERPSVSQDRGRDRYKGTAVGPGRRGEAEGGPCLSQATAGDRRNDGAEAPRHSAATRARAVLVTATGPTRPAGLATPPAWPPVLFLLRMLGRSLASFFLSDCPSFFSVIGALFFF